MKVVTYLSDVVVAGEGDSAPTCSRGRVRLRCSEDSENGKHRSHVTREWDGRTEEFWDVI